MAKCLKILRVIIASLLILLLLITLLGCWIIFTETGTRLLFSTAERYQLLSYESLEGSISDGFAIRQLAIHQDIVNIQIDELALSADWRQVLDSKVNIQQLAIQNIVVQLSATPEKKPETEALDLSFLNDRLVFLPLDVNLQQLSITQLTLIKDNQHHRIDNIQLSAFIDERGISASKINADYQRSNVQLAGDLLFAPKLSVDITISWQTTLPEHSKINGSDKINGSARIKGTGKQLRIDHQTSGGVASDLVIDLHNWRKQPQLTLRGNVDTLSWPLENSSSPRLSDISFKAQGDLSGLQTTANAQLQLNQKSTNSLALKADLNASQININALELNDQNGGNVILSGQLTWPDKQLNWQTVAVFNLFDAQSLHPSLPQELAGKLAITGAFHEKLQLNIISKNLRGKLQRQAVESQLNIQLAGKDLFIKGLSARLGDNQLTASGEVRNSKLNIRFDSQLTELKYFYPNSKGAIQANGLLTGSLASPTLEARLSAQDLSINNLVANDVKLNIQLLDGHFITSANKLTAQQLRYNNVYLDQLELQLDGPWQEPRIQFQTNSPLLSTGLGLTLNLKQLEQITGKLTELHITGTENAGENIGHWQLAQPVNFELATESWFFTPLCLQSSGQLCIDARSTDKKLNAQLDAKQLPLALLNASGLLLPSMNGKLDITAQLETIDGRQRGQLRISQSDVDTPLLLTAADDSNTQLRIADLVVEGQLQNDTLDGSLNARLNDTGTLSSEFKIQQPFNTHSPLQAHINYSIPDLQPYALLIPEVDNLNGELTGNIQFSQSLQKPQVTLFTRLSVPKIYINALAMEWHDLNAEITTLSANRQQLKASLKTGDGQLKVDGILDFSSRENWFSEINIKGDKVLLLDQSQRRVVASPDLQLTANAEHLEVAGLLHIPDAKLIVTPSPSRLALTADAVIHHNNQQLTNNSQPYDYLLNLDVLLGDQVHVEAYGLTTRVNGKLHLSKQVSQQLLGQGEINLVDGAYKAYGQDLVIERGVIRFTGLLNKPEIDLTASRTVKSVIAGLKVNGPVDNLRTRLYSRPPLSDSEILSYIIRGKPLRDANAADQNALANALLAYSISQSTPLTSKLTELSGLDEIGLEAEEGVETLGFTLGKYITPRLYARYGIGVIDKLSKVFLQYQLSDKLYLETESGQGQSVDLMYRSR